MSDHEATARPSRLRRAGRVTWRVTKWTAIVAILAIVLAVGYIAWTNHRATRAVAQLEQQLAARNIPADVQAWRRQHFGVTDEARDGTPLYRAAMAANEMPYEYGRHLPIIGRGDGPEPMARIHPDTAAVIAEAIEGRQHVFALVEAAGPYDQFDFGLIDANEPEQLDASLLGEARRLARWLELRTLHAQATNDTELATQAILQVFHLNHALEWEPTLLAELVRMSIDALAVAAIEDTLSRLTLEPEQLEAWREALRHRADTASLERVLQSEMLYSRMIVFDRERLRDEAVRIRRHLREFRDSEIFEYFEETNAWTATWMPDGMFRVWVAVCPGWLQLRALDEFSPGMHEYDALTALGDDWPAIARHLTEERTSPPVTSASEASLRSSMLAMVRLRAKRLTADAGLAVEQFRLAHDRWPDDLAEVEAALDQTLPLDPFTGAALRYRTTDTGVVVYSVGDNFTDDGGHQPWDRNPDHPDARDVVFRLYDPERRNSLPAVRHSPEAEVDDPYWNDNPAQ